MDPSSETMELRGNMEEKKTKDRTLRGAWYLFTEAAALYPVRGNRLSVYVFWP